MSASTAGFNLPSQICSERRLVSWVNGLICPVAVLTTRSVLQRALHYVETIEMGAFQNKKSQCLDDLWVTVLDMTLYDQ